MENGSEVFVLADEVGDAGSSCFSDFGFLVCAGEDDESVKVGLVDLGDVFLDFEDKILVEVVHLLYQEMEYSKGVLKGTSGSQFVDGQDAQANENESHLIGNILAEGSSGKQIGN